MSLLFDQFSIKGTIYMMMKSWRRNVSHASLFLLLYFTMLFLTCFPFAPLANFFFCYASYFLLYRKIIMPLLKRKRLAPVEPPRYDADKKESRNSLVWYSPLRKEIFKDYSYPFSIWLTNFFLLEHALSSRSSFFNPKFFTLNLSLTLSLSF